MHNKFVQTRNTKAFLAGVAALRQRGAGEACLMLVSGQPGLSKTVTAKWWAVQNGAPFVRAKAEWTPSWMLRDILATITNTEAAPSFEKMYKQVLTALADQTRRAEREGTVSALVIDEIDHIANSQKMMEALRDIGDALEIPIILVGMGKVEQKLNRYPQIASRIGQRVKFEELDLTDARAMVTGLAEVEVADDLISFLNGKTSYAREIKEAIAPIERTGRRNPGKPVDLAAMAGQTLFNERGAGAPVKVPGAR